MGRPGISKSEVVRAYVSLLKQRREPSLLNLRLELGHGSYTTIASHVEALRFIRPNASGRVDQHGKRLKTRGLKLSTRRR